MELITLPRLWSVLIVNLLLTLVCGERTRLEEWRVRKNSVTLSGFSSGGTFAQHMQFSYPSSFSGIAVFSHNYYRCGPGNGSQKDYDDACTIPDDPSTSRPYDPNMAINDIQRFYENGLIGNPALLKNKKLYVFVGLRSFLFTPEMSLNILKIYEPLIQNPKNIRTRVMDAGFLMPSDSYGGECTNSNTQNTSFIGNCGFSGALESLQFLLGPTIKKPSKGFKARHQCNNFLWVYNERLEPLQTFDQTEFFTNERHDMDSEGFLYVPKACKHVVKGKGKRSLQFTFGESKPSECYLHFYFHGCFSGREFLGMNHTLNSGFLEVAEANNIVVVFPQSVKSPENDVGCWDTYGFTGKDYATRKGAQVEVVNRMLQRILGHGIQFPSERREPFKRQDTNPEQDVKGGFGYRKRGPRRPF